MLLNTHTVTMDCSDAPDKSTVNVCSRSNTVEPRLLDFWLTVIATTGIEKAQRACQHAEIWWQTPRNSQQFKALQHVCCWHRIALM